MLSYILCPPETLLTTCINLLPSNANLSEKLRLKSQINIINFTRRYTDSPQMFINILISH
jgi:hypothetical protein